jgi:hypothetical protein
MLLYITFHSASEATIVMLSVVFAMSCIYARHWTSGLQRAATSP